jgi:hypothetical protein
MVIDRQRELQRLARRQPRRTRGRRSISRRLGLALMRAGRRLAGPDELMDRRLQLLVFTNNRRS